MKIAILTLHDELFQPMANFTLPNKEIYSKIHSYKLFYKNKNFSEPANLGWEKIKLIKELIETKECDWIFWLGCDTVITNLSKKIEEIIDENYHIIVATDSHGVNSDSMLIKSSEKSLNFLNEMLSPKPEYVNHIEFEQGVMADLFKSQYSDIVKYVPQKTMNSYLYDYYVHMPDYSEKKDKFGNIGEWSKGDFIIHFPGIPYSEKIRNCMYFCEKALAFYNEQKDKI